MSDIPGISDRLRQIRQEREALRALREAARTDPAARQEMRARREARHASRVASGNHIPPWIRYMEDDHGPWGFFIYRCACYENPARWELYRATLDQVWENSWHFFWENQREMGVTEEMYQRVRRRMDLRWIEEDEGLEGQGVDEVRRRFKMSQDAMPSLNDEPRLREDPWNLNLPIPYHMDRYVCLYVDEDSVSSLIGPPGEESPFPDELHDQEEQARDSYLLAVDSEYSPDYEGYLTSQGAEPYQGWAKVFTGLVFTELCPRRTYINDHLPLDKVYQESYGPLPPGNGIWFG